MFKKTKKGKNKTIKLGSLLTIAIIMVSGLLMITIVTSDNFISSDRIGEPKTSNIDVSTYRYPLNDPHDHEIYGYYYTPTAIWPDPNTDWAESLGGNTYSYNYDALATEWVFEVSDIMYFDVTPDPEHEGLPLYDIFITIFIKAYPRTPGGGYNRINIKHYNQDGSSSLEQVIDTDYENNLFNYTMNSRTSGSWNHHQLEDPDVENYISDNNIITIQIDTVNYGWWQPINWWYVYWSPGVRVEMDYASALIFYEV